MIRLSNLLASGLLSVSGSMCLGQEVHPAASTTVVSSSKAIPPVPKPASRVPQTRLGVTQLFPDLEQQRLREMGAWLARMGDAVYGTRGGPWEPVARQYGYCYKGSTVFVHLLQDYPGTTFKVPALGGLRVKRVYEVYTGRPLPFEGDGAVTVRDIDRTSSTADSVIAVEYQDEVQRVWTP